MELNASGRTLKKVLSGSAGLADIFLLGKLFSKLTCPVDKGLGK